MAGKQISEIKPASRLNRKTLAAISVVLSQIARSKIEEDIYHAHEMLQMALRSEFSKDEPFVVACVAHDVERSLPCRLRPEDFKTYDIFKEKHQQKSAGILEKILKGFSFPEEFMSRAVFLVRNHETGGKKDRALQELVYLDVLSFMNTNSAFYLKREGRKKLFERIIWGLKRLNPAQIQRIKSEVEVKDETVREVFLQALERLRL